MAAWAAGDRVGLRIPGLPRLVKLGLTTAGGGGGAGGCSSTMETSGSTRDMVMPLGNIGPGGGTGRLGTEATGLLLACGLNEDTEEILRPEWDESLRWLGKVWGGGGLTG